jgi:hypothetical protein
MALLYVSEYPALGRFPKLAGREKPNSLQLFPRVDVSDNFGQSWSETAQKPEK